MAPLLAHVVNASCIAMVISLSKELNLSGLFSVMRAMLFLISNSIEDIIIGCCIFK
jgi:hypothetical protein